MKRLVFSSFEKPAPGEERCCLESPLTFYFLFLNGENLSKNKNPSMTPIKKKRFAKTRFWVRGSGYPLGRYLMRGSTPLGPKLSLY